MRGNLNTTTVPIILIPSLELKPVLVSSQRYLELRVADFCVYSTVTSFQLAISLPSYQPGHSFELETLLRHADRCMVGFLATGALSHVFWQGTSTGLPREPKMAYLRNIL